MSKSAQRVEDMTVPDVISIDGEGYTPSLGYVQDGAVMRPSYGSHLYTLLLARCMRGEHDRNPQEVRDSDSWGERTHSIDDWSHGLTTSRILGFLTRIPKPHGYLAVSYFFNYDVTCWLKDLSPEHLKTLWDAGRVFWYDDAWERWYYIEYIPKKIFFVGEVPQSALEDPTWKPNSWRWGSHRCIRIYDVSGFAQTAFVKAMEGWINPEMLQTIRQGKKRRGGFGPDDAQYVFAYCQAEMDALNAYVRRAYRTLLDDGIKLSSWHGGGALAGYLLKKNRVNRYVQDPQGEENAGIRRAILHAYFGGRSEIFRQGLLDNVHNFDIGSAYPAASVWIPHLVGGRWERVPSYQPDKPYALYHVRWDIRGSGIGIGPFPYRYKHEVYFPTTGEGVYHAVEVAAALKYYPAGSIRVLSGTVLHPASAYLPMEWVRPFAEGRVAHKKTAPHLAILEKYGANSLYGRLAQSHPSTDVVAPYQCYYAAGFITAFTRARLLDFTFQGGRTGEDIIAYMTDGVLCHDGTRTQYVGTGLGEFEYAGQIERRILLLEPGVWYEEETTEEERARKRREEDGSYDARTDKYRRQAKTRGLAKSSIGYQQVLAEWRTHGNGGSLSFPETRFYAMGYCVGTGDYGRLGQWITEERVMSFAPSKKFSSPMDGLPHDTYELRASEFEGSVSEMYLPKDPSDPSEAQRQLRRDLEARERELCLRDGQPDWEEGMVGV